MYTAPLSSTTIPFIITEKKPLFSVLSIKDSSVMSARLESLLKSGANVNETEDEFKLNILQKCIIDEYSYKELSKIFDILLNHEIDVNYQDVDGCTALHYAICEEQYELAKILLNNGANPAIVDKNGETAFDDLKSIVNPDPLKVEQRKEMLQLLKTTATDAIKYIIDKKLNTANLSKFQDFDHFDLKFLSINCPQLKKLSIKSLKFSDANLEEALEKFPNLKSLDIGWCIQMTGNALKKSPNLKNLNLRGLWRISNNKLIDLFENFPNLKSLNITKCIQITNDCVATIAKNHPFLQIIR